MTYNDILRRFRYAVDLSDDAMVEIFAKAGEKLTTEQMLQLLKREDEPGYQECSEEQMTAFLNALIIYTRGEQKSQPGKAVADERPLNNNVILKKLRIALEMREQDMLEVFACAGFRLSKGELSALFRKKGHKNYKPCGDQLLRNFLKGLTLHNRSST
ncbi:MAG: DUF1456 family protein [Desulfuromonas sp.]|nr:DUF1456 family protein [Desulfuromonas sp.]